MRALIVGCGKVAGGYNRGIDDTFVLSHALAYIRHPQYEIAGCVDTNAAAREEFCDRWNVPSGYESLEDAFNDQSYDIVSICTPTGTHLDILERLLRYDVSRVFAEKPMDGDPVRALNLGRQYEDRGRPVAVNFTRRWAPEIVALRNEITTGAWGRLGSAVGWYSGGVLNNGSHMLNLVEFLTGKAIDIICVGKARHDGLVADPTMDATLDLEGVPLHLIGCDAHDHTRFELTLSFSGGVVEILEQGFFVRRRMLEPSAIFPGVQWPAEGKRSPSRYGEAMLRALDDLANWRVGQRLASDVFNAVSSIQLAIAIRDSFGRVE